MLQPNDVHMRKIKVLLLGGNGFLGKGLQDEFKKRAIEFESVDVKELDLSDVINIYKLERKIRESTHVVLLAAKLGRVLFNNNPKPNAEYNTKILRNAIMALRLAFQLSGEPIDFTFYSSSEVFGSSDDIQSVIDENTMPKINNVGRGQYAAQKYYAECELKDILQKEKIFSRLKIIRPFNVSGKYQRRGVIYDMVKTALLKRKIWFSDDTTRSFTSSEYAQKKSADIILSDECDLYIENLSENLTYSMESVAKYFIKPIVGKDVVLERRPPDDKIRYRQTSLPTDFLDNGSDIMWRIVENVKREVEHA